VAECGKIFEKICLESIYLCAMSQFVVSARKYRPQRFSDVVGQAHVSQTLKNALKTEHIAHSFLFCGPRGVGKTTNARILAKILNCTDRTPDFEACGACDSCLAFDRNASFNIIELDAASNNSVDDIRRIVEQVRFPPQQGKYKVFIIDEVHMLSASAFNAFLKTLEEPPPYAIFILATTEKHKIIPTILSRCQIFDFRRIQIPDTVAHLQKICASEGISAETDALHIIAQKADGALRDALSIFDRIVSASVDKTVRYDDVLENLNVLDYDYYFKMTEALLAEDVSKTLNIYNDVMRKGFDGEIFITGLAEHFRNILVCKDVQTLQLLEVGDKLKERYQAQALIANTSFILTALNLLNDCDVNFKQARNKQLHVEMALIKTAYISRAVDMATLAEKKTPDVKVAPQKAEKKTDNKAFSSESSDSRSDAPYSPPSEYQEEKNELSTVQEELIPVSPEGETPPGPAISTVKTMSAGSMLSMPKIGSIDSIGKMIEEEEAIIAQAVSKLNYQNLTESWKKYAETHESPSTKTAILNAQLDLEDTKIIARVGTELAVGFIQSEFRLPDFLRFDLSTPHLTLEVKLDNTLTPEESKLTPSVKKYLSPREKLKLMMEVNPLVKDLALKLNLKPDE
jgi:DNA polymerase III subunit gamma/tau